MSELTQEERERLLKLEEKLHERVVGQDAAVRRRIQTEVENPLAEALLQGRFSRVDRVLVGFDKEEGRVTFKKVEVQGSTLSND